MQATLTLDVVTPEKAIAQNVEVDRVVVPGKLGQMDILPGHKNLLSSMKAGSFAYHHKGENKLVWAFLSGGFIHLESGKITVLAQTLELTREMDRSKAKIDLDEALDILKTADSGSAEYKKAVEDKQHAEAKLEALDHSEKH